jgi:parallel beta-helix repeat protein
MGDLRAAWRGGWLVIAAALAGCAPVAARATTYYVSPSGADTAAGSQSAPWRTLQHAADQLQPGDSVQIGAGLYRESVRLPRGGTAQAPVTLAAQPGARVVVTGADRLADGWTRVPGPDPVYSHDWPHVFPIDYRADRTPVLSHPDDREHELTGRAEQVIESGRVMRQTLRREQLAPGSFFVDLAAKRLFVWLHTNGDPKQAEIEASTRDTWLTAEPSVSYVHVRGITFRYAANHAQRGAFVIGSLFTGSPARDWVVEDCVFERTNACGASFSGEGHRFRRRVFQDNGQLGFGTARCHLTRMEACGVYRNNTKGYSTGWEAGGLKVTLSRGFVMDRCRVADNRGPGVWFDIGNEQSEVSHCTITDNDEAGIFYEISYSLHAHDNLIVNNANQGETPGGAWGAGGITLSSSQDCVVENNTLVGNRDGIDFREQDRSTPRIDAPPGTREERVFNRGHVVRGNVVADSQAYNIGLWMDSTFFGPHPSGNDRDRPASEDPKGLGFRFERNLLLALPGRPNYLYGAPWRPRSKTATTPAEFTAASGIPDSSQVGDPRFVDLAAGDYRLQPGSPATALHAGRRE